MRRLKARGGCLHLTHQGLAAVWQRDKDTGATIGLGAKSQAASMRPHECRRNGGAQAGPATRVFGREERIAEARQLLRLGSFIAPMRMLCTHGEHWQNNWLPCHD